MKQAGRLMAVAVAAVVVVAAGCVPPDPGTTTTTTSTTSTTTSTTLPPTTGTVRVVVSLPGAPTGLDPVPPAWVVRCPGVVAPGDCLEGYREVGADGVVEYASLSPGTWTVGVVSSVLGTVPVTRTVTVTAGARTDVDAAIDWPAATGTVQGAVTLTGLPDGVEPPFRSVRACPGSVTVTIDCADGRTAHLAGGRYGATLGAGTWSLAAAYQSPGAVVPGPWIVGPTTEVAVVGGTAVERPLAVTWQPTGIVAGRVTIAGDVPDGVSPGRLVQVCPGTLSSVSQCPGGALRVGTDADGRFTAYVAPGPVTLFGRYSAGGRFAVGAPTAVTLAAGVVTTVDLSVTWQPVAVVRGTAGVTGAPVGLPFARFVRVCPGDVAITAPPCPGGQFLPPGPGGAYELFLDAGTWTLAHTYSLSGSYVVGPRSVLTLAAPSVTTQDLAVDWVPVGRVTGTVGVTGSGAAGFGLRSVYACPGEVVATSSCAGVRIVSASGPGHTYDAHLAPGTWSLAGTASDGFTTRLGATTTLVLDAGTTTSLDLAVTTD